MVRHSKVQVQVLSLYREFMRLSKTQPGLRDYVRSEFKKNAVIPRTNTLQIEQCYRRGLRQLEMLKRKDVKGVGVFTKSE
jgi:succinate dehydrogenase assembly factor 1